MLVIGLILVLIALVVVGFMAFGTANLDKVEIDLGVLTANLNPLEIFGLGALCIVVLVLGLLLMFTGLRRQRRKRKELHELRQKADLAERAAPRQDARPETRHQTRPQARPEARPQARPESGAPQQSLPSDRAVRRDPGTPPDGDRIVTDRPGGPDGSR